jgi:MoCo/4Fe-4S cofactor protein with predicted Tat translocation signal
MTSVDPRPASSPGLSASASLSSASLSSGPIPSAPSMNEPSVHASTTESAPTDLYWRSLGQLEQAAADPSAAAAEVAREFPDDIADAPDEVSRRGFLSAVAASVALAGLTSCRKPVTKILPFNKRPEGFKPGLPQQYATTLVRGGRGIGVLVKSSDGRPTKIDGNPAHPSSLGGTDMRLQAELIQLYDPARSRRAVRPLAAATGDGHDAAHGEHGHRPAPAPDVWAEFHDWMEQTAAKEIANKQGEGLHVLMPPTSSPSVLAAIARIKSATYPKARFHHWHALHHDTELAGAQLAFGKPVATHPDFAKADVVVALDCDFLGADGNNLRHSRQWAEARRAPAPGKKLSRLYAVESTYTVTGTAADHRFRTKSGDVAAVAFALAKALAVGASSELDQELSAHPPAQFDRAGKKWVEIVARDLQLARGRSLVVVGPRQPAVVHAIVHAINHALGNVNQTVRHTAVPEGLAQSAVASIQELAVAIEKGTCSLLVCLGTNPAYDAPAELRFADLLRDKKGMTVVHVGSHVDETARLCDWHLPLAHDLESWGDACAHDGTVSMQQPLVAPLHGGVSVLEFLGYLNQDPNYQDLVAARDTTFGYGLVKGYWQGRVQAADFATQWWPRALHEGFVEGTALANEAATFQAAPVAAAVKAHPKTTGIEVVLRGCFKMADGRYATNSWMQEIPEPVTKLSWDNAALISLATARQLDVENGDSLTIEATVKGATVQVQAPAWIVPGHADESITLSLGWGRDLPDAKVGHRTGCNAYPLREAGQWILTGCKVGRGTTHHDLVTTQEQGTMAGRAIVRETTAAAYQADPRWAPKMSPLDQAAALHGHTEAQAAKSLWVERGYMLGKNSPDPEVRKSPYQWGMVIDLNACTGCSACMVACVAENNVPMVGKIQVRRNREMFWLRTDRYFSSRAVGPNASRDDLLSAAEDPQVANMPVPCMQCENAPCESVCPVAATTHSPDGLNDMVYNRCIGTRYCSNNCPYKVRRFNYLDFIGNAPDTKRMAFNPDVTVRSRGVMEKCTYCVQRINGGRITAKLTGKKVGEGENDVHVTTACAQACPTQAITFGNLLDANSSVAKLARLDLNYGLLSELNTKPRTTYLGRVRNPNPELA